MSVFEQVQELPSFRKARDETISRKVIGKILEAGRNAPSPGNVQSIEFIVVEDSHKKELIYKTTDDERVQEAPTAVIVLADIERMKRRTGEAAEVFCYSEAACTIQNMRLVAAENEIASAWLSGFDENLLNQRFDIPDGKSALGVVLLAYTDQPVYSEGGFDLTDICYYDEYDNQINSFWDEPGWRGIKTESRIQEKKANGLVDSLRRKLEQIL